MPPSEKHWKTMARSQFSWEQDALDFIHERFPAQDNYRAWSNFEFIADDGSINEVDLLVLCPQGIFLIEIKSNPGHLWGDAQDWTWHHDGRRKTVENPLILANRKCKRLKSLLGRQKAFRDGGQFFIEPLVFLSHSEAKSHLNGNATFAICFRDSEKSPDGTSDTSRPGIMGAIRRRECPGLKQFDSSQVNRPLIKAVTQSMEQAGIKPSQKARRVGDFILDDLVFDSPTGLYQDWLAHHVSHPSTLRCARIYMLSRQLTGEDREIAGKAAAREFQLLERLDHPSILKADPPTECEFGPVLFLRRDPESVRLDHFLQEQGDSLPVDQRLDILRQIAEVISYAHGRKIIHRSLSPQSILVKRDAKGRPLIQIFNWQTGARLSGNSDTRVVTRMSMTLHASQLIEDSSLVYIAPEAIAGNADGGTELDVFSLGALTYLLFSGRPPAASVTELQQKLKSSLSNGLNISEVMDGAVDSLVELVLTTANSIGEDRESVEGFLAGLSLVEEELTRPDESSLANPLQATKNDVLAGGYIVKKRLGSGSVSIVYLVDLNGVEQVLKVARASQYNLRIKEEFEVLSTIKDKVRSRIVVAPFKLVEFGDLTGFTMESAGEKTLARFLREEGRLDLTYLKRFGDDLLRTIRDLDDAGGIAHRDIKPENMGIRMPGKKQYQLCLFDFSLSKASPEDISVGTPGYLDPFISERKVKRWDISSECFSAAMTLHEMATGSLPTWGDGKSDPASIRAEVNIQPERFDPDLRDRFVRFFEKALRRDHGHRFDNPDEMLKAWSDIFATIDDRKKSRTAHPAEEDSEGDGLPYELPELVTPGTQLILLSLSTRLLNTLDRLNLVSVADLSGFPLRRIYRLPGVGNKTRRELGALVKALRERLPDLEVDPAKAIDAAAADEDSPSDAFASVDLIARQVSVIGRGNDRVAEQEILQAFLGWADQEAAREWFSQTDLATRLGVTRQRVGQVITEARERGKRFPSITSLRDLIYEILCSQAGVVTHSELIAAVLAARGSTFEEPKRTQMASIATRAALETERSLNQPRFQEYRSGGRIFVAIAPELKNYAAALGLVADNLAKADPLPSPGSVLDAIHSIRPPGFPEGIAVPTDLRLCQLAVAASSNAALSSRMEIYPIGMSPVKALALSQNALFGGTLTIDEIRNRVAARLPHASPMPGRPDLDDLLREVGLDLKWQPDAADGRGAYQTPGADGLSLHSSLTLTSRFTTRSGPVRPTGDLSPEVAEALVIEEKLGYAARNGSFLTLSVPQGSEEQACIELQRRFDIDIRDLDRIFIDRMKREAETAGADWSVVLKADAAAQQDSAGWQNLQILVERCLPDVVAQLRSPDRTRLAIHPGLLARYDQMHVLNGIIADIGRVNGIHGLWLMVPANDQSPLPVLNQKAIPITNPAQHIRLNRAWLANKHRS
jgi:serine/threonine protein kinase